MTRRDMPDLLSDTESKQANTFVPSVIIELKEI